MKRNDVASSVTEIQLIAECWSEIFPDLPFEASQAWRESGADSLKSLHFILRLEQSLGRSVPLDYIGPETSPADLARLLAGDGGPAGGGPRVFLVPGLLGDEPRLADFRRSLDGRIRFETLRLPDIEHSATLLSDMEQTARLLMAEVERLEPAGPVRLAGYSFGGLVALELAALLSEAGREVAFVGLLDPFLAIRPWKRILPADQPRRAPMLIARHPFSLASGGWRALRDRAHFGIPLMLGRLETARRRLQTASAQLPPEVLYWRRQRLVGLLRWRALRNWRPKAIEVPTLLVVSDEAGDHFKASRWDRLLSNRRLLHVGGRHLELFREAALPVIGEAFVEMARRGTGDGTGET